MGAGGRGLNGGVRQCSRCAAVAGPFRDSLVAVDDVKRVAVLAVTGNGSIAQRFARDQSISTRRKAGRRR